MIFWLLLALSILIQGQEATSELRDLQSILDAITPEPEGAPMHSTVVELSAGNFSRVLKGKWIILFYAPFCPRSNQASMTLGHLSDFLGQKGFSLGQVDAARDDVLADRFFIFSFPMLKMFDNGMIYPFDGSPVKPAIMDFVNRKWVDKVPLQFYSGSSQLLKLTDEQFELATTSRIQWLVMFYAPWCLVSQATLPYFDAWAAKLTTLGVKVAIFDGSTSYQTDRFEIKGFPAIFLVGGGQMVEFHAKRTVDELTTFVKTGFNSPSTKSVPPLRAWPEILSGHLLLAFQILSQDAEEIWKFKKTAILLVYLLGIILCGVLLECWRVFCNRARKLPNQVVSQTRAPPKARTISKKQL